MIDKKKTLKKLESSRAIAAIAGPIAAPKVAKDVPAAFMDRLSQEEKSVVSTIVEGIDAPAHATDCARTLKRQRYAREGALLQEEIDKLQEHGTAEDLAQIDVLWQRKKDLLSLIETLTP